MTGQLPSIAAAALQRRGFSGLAVERDRLRDDSAWPNWPDSCCSSAARGSGKSHLAAIWARRARRALPPRALRLDCASPRQLVRRTCSSRTPTGPRARRNCSICSTSGQNGASPAHDRAAARRWGVRRRTCCRACAARRWSKSSAGRGSDARGSRQAVRRPADSPSRRRDRLSGARIERSLDAARHRRGARRGGARRGRPITPADGGGRVLATAMNMIETGGRKRICLGSDAEAPAAGMP